MKKHIILSVFICFLSLFVFSDKVYADEEITINNPFYGKKDSDISEEFIYLMDKLCKYTSPPMIDPDWGQTSSGGTGTSGCYYHFKSNDSDKIGLKEKKLDCKDGKGCWTKEKFEYEKIKITLVDKIKVVPSSKKIFEQYLGEQKCGGASSCLTIYDDITDEEVSSSVDVGDTCYSQIVTYNYKKENVGDFSFPLRHDDANENFSLGGEYSDLNFDPLSQYATKSKNKYIFHPKNSSEFADISKTIYQKYKKNVESGDKNPCNGIAVFCMGSESSVDKPVWYLETDIDKCSGTVDYTGQGQVFGESIKVIGNIDDFDLADHIVYDDTEILKSICQDGKLFGDANLADKLQLVINVFKILVPVILIVLGSLDFAKAVFAQDEAGIKKAQTAFIKRLIIAVVIFLIPTIIHLILTIASSVWGEDKFDPSLCGLFK